MKNLSKAATPFLPPTYSLGIKDFRLRISD